MTRNDHHGPLFEHAVVRACVLDRHLDAPRGCGGGPRAAPGGGGGRTRLSVACASAGGRAVGRSGGRAVGWAMPVPAPAPPAAPRARAPPRVRAWLARAGLQRHEGLAALSERQFAGLLMAVRGAARWARGLLQRARRRDTTLRRAGPPTHPRGRAGGRGENTRRHLGRGGGAARGGGCPEARARVPPPA